MVGGMVGGAMVGGVTHHVFASDENSKTVVLIDDIYMCDWLQ